MTTEMSNATTQESLGIDAHSTQDEGEATQLIGEGASDDGSGDAPLPVQALPDFFTIVRLDGVHRRAYTMTMGTTVVLGRMGLVLPNNGPILLPHAAGSLTPDYMKKLSREICLLKCIPPSEGEQGATLCLENHMNRSNPFGLQVLRPVEGGGDAQTGSPEPIPIKPFPSADTSTFGLEQGDRVCLGIPMAGRWSHFFVYRGEAPASVGSADAVAAPAAVSAVPVASCNGVAPAPVCQPTQVQQPTMGPAGDAAVKDSSSSKELIVAVGSLENVVGFITLEPGMTIEGARQMIMDEIDDDVLPLEGWKFMRMQMGRPVPVSIKQEKKLLATDFLPTVVIATPRAPPAQPRSPLPAAPVVTPAPLMAAAARDATTEEAGSPPKRPMPPPPPRFSMSSEPDDHEEMVMPEDEWVVEEEPKKRTADSGKKARQQGRKQADEMILSDDEPEDERAGQKRRQPSRIAKETKRRRVEVESEEEDLFSLSDKDEAEEDDDDDDEEVVMEVDDSEDEVELEGEEEKEGEATGGAAMAFRIDLPTVRKECNTLLTRLQAGLETERRAGAPLRNTEQYKEEIQDTVLKSALLDTKIGVVGDTGAGKSSLLNALVHEESVLETSGWRACTAVCTELSYLHEGEGYVGEIHFLSKEEWEVELEDLLSEALNDEKKMKRVFDGESPQAIAIDKLVTVYGQGIQGNVIVNKNMLSYRNQITRRLGEVMVVQEADARDFRKKLAPYVASTDRQSQAYWPIIKRICLRSSNWKVLEQGGILVDLPGLRDANAARARVCEQYKKECSILLICAPIHRAVDNRTAKDLLGEQFKRQLLLDGQMSNLAFCATKADDVNPTEILKDFAEIPQEIQALLDKQDEVADKVREHKQILKDLRRGRVELVNKRKSIKKRLREVESALHERSMKKGAERKDDEMKVVLDPASLKEEEGRLLAELKQLGDVNDMDKEIKGLERTLNKLEVERRSQQRQMNAACARVRNTTSKREIRRTSDWGSLMDIKRKAKLRARRKATGRSEEEEDEDEEEDDDDDGLDVDQDLPVFTISANEYLRLLGKMRADGDVRTFTKRADTEVPVLQRYILSFTGERRMQAVHAYVKKVQSICEHIFSQLADTGTSDKATRRALYEAYNKRKCEARTLIQGQRDNGIRSIKSLTDRTLGTGLAEGAANAERQVMATMHSWADQSRRRFKGGPPENKGLHAASFRAALRREGVYASPSAGEVMLNDEMADPILREIATAWDEILNRKIPKLLEEFKRVLVVTLEAAFLKHYTRQDLQLLSVDNSRIERAAQVFMNQVPRKIDEHLAQLLQEVTSQQRDLNRSLPEEIRTAMRPAYNQGALERGGGCTDRARHAMYGHMQRHKQSIFSNAASGMHKSLTDLIIQIQKRLTVTEDKCLQTVDGIFSIFWNGPVDADAATKLHERVLPFVADISREMQRVCASVDESLVTFRVDDRLKELEERRKKEEEKKVAAEEEGGAGGGEEEKQEEKAEVETTGLAVVQTMSVHETVHVRVAQAAALGEVIDLCDDD